MLTIF